MKDPYEITVMGKSTFVLIPALNPDKKLVSLVDELHTEGFRILVVDDGSTSDCKPIWQALRYKATVLRHSENAGKGAALKTGFRYILGCEPNAGYIVTADADGQHLAKDIQTVALTAWLHPGTLVLGSRCFTGKQVPLRSRIGNRIMCGLYHLACGAQLPDTQTGLRAFDAALLPFLCDIPGTRYEYEMNVLLRCGRDRVPMHSFPIETVYLDKHNTVSHFHPLRDSWRIIKTFLLFLPHRKRRKLPPFLVGEDLLRKDTHSSTMPTIQ
ncbi:MAG: glycosyltransferase family 2 protein [Pygmaiobacter sp.]|nr:glycosyltransferase family 2 protein [Pygmaiobacter sp.]